jgi:protein-L-isoaspartate(D-aspartate) O-methyltransferase
MNNETHLDYERLRESMVREQLVSRDITNFRVLDAMRSVPRHEFVPADVRHLAYHDGALPIGYNQSISQPYVVALMLQLLQLSGHETVLEIGTGSGYQTALLCRLAASVFSLERDDRLASRAGVLLAQQECRNVDIHVGDGSQGLADMAPFDAIIVSASVPAIPAPLRAQMRNNGRLVLPVGSREQQYLQLVRRNFDRWDAERVLSVRFVPLIGYYGFKEA